MPGTLLAQPSGWDVIATAGAALTSDFSSASDVESTSTVGARVRYRPIPLVALAGEVWRGSFDSSGEVWGAGGHLVAIPWAGRSLALQPTFAFGLERIAGDDEEDRGPAFVFGLGIESGIASRLFLTVSGRHHFLAVDEDPEPLSDEPGRTVDTGRDVSVWELRVGIGVSWGDRP